MEKFYDFKVDVGQFRTFLQKVAGANIAIASIVSAAALGTMVRRIDLQRVTGYGISAIPALPPEVMLFVGPVCGLFEFCSNFIRPASPSSVLLPCFIALAAVPTSLSDRWY